ncbi:MAG: hypothetical protein F4Y61_02875 [Rhodothermaceae bacterium]|nr:hypothetical protein [Rhodothermaceae bacterium]MYF79854.1 hypothetical protein [Chloroflexota bacterium]
MSKRKYRVIDTETGIERMVEIEEVEPGKRLVTLYPGVDEEDYYLRDILDQCEIEYAVNKKDG